MNGKTRTTIVRTIVGGISIFTVSIVLLLHNAWGDERYELKADAIEKQIHRLDTQITVYATEILFAESEKEKEKFMAIKAIFEREKRAYEIQLADKLKDI